MADSIARFTFEDSAIRGEHVALEHSYQELLAIHHYPPVVARLLGEMAAAACLLAQTIKFDGTLTLQVRSGGEIPLIMAEVDNHLQFRAIARQAQQASSPYFANLLRQGQLCLTIQPRGGKPYQGIVSLDDHSLASSLESYFGQSEQLPTRFWLGADGQRAAGLLLQQMPGADGSDHWQHLQQLAATVTPEELLTVERETLLYHLYHQDNLRLHPEQPARFHCTCNRQRLEQVLVSLGRTELDDIIAERGLIEVNCEFCNRFYQFDPADVATLFALEAPPQSH